jgi:hypothetical protein
MDVIKLSSSLVETSTDDPILQKLDFINEAVYLAFEAGSLVACHSEVCGTSPCECAKKLALIMQDLHNLGYSGKDYLIDE